MFVRARRSATIRTRLDPDTVRERLAALAAAGGPEGFDRLMASGFFLDGGSVGRRDFHLDYRFNSAKNPQTYAVHGRLVDTPDWRIVRLKLTAHDPWLGPMELLLLGAFLAFHAVMGELPARAAVGALLLVMVVYALANLLYIPEVVTSRIAGQIASALNGSVRHGGEWVVPR